MERCPVCKASYKGRSPCRRCGADLSLLAHVEETAARCLEDARRALADADYERAFALARRSLSLRRTPEALDILEQAALLTGRIPVGGRRFLMGRHD